MSVQCTPRLCQRVDTRWRTRGGHDRPSRAAAVRFACVLARSHPTIFYIWVLEMVLLFDHLCCNDQPFKLDFMYSAEDVNSVQRCAAQQIIMILPAGSLRLC